MIVLRNAKNIPHLSYHDIAKAFGKVSREFEQEVDENSVGSPKAKGNFYGKAAKRIPLWAKHPEQYCHKIIRGFF